MRNFSRRAEVEQTILKKGKARDFFSAYREGTLEAGLCAALERDISQNQQLARDYAAFCVAVEGLEAQAEHEVDVPLYLPERISAAVDRSIWERAQRAPSPLASWWRTLAYASVAALVLVAAIATLRNPAGPGESAAGIAGGGSVATELEVIDGQLRLRTPPADGRILIRNALTGAEIANIASLGRPLDVPLVNMAQAAVLVEIVTGEPQSIWVALSGRAAGSNKPAEGSVAEFALALAARYRLPVQVRVTDPNAPMAWELDSSDALAEAREHAESLSLSVEMRHSGILFIAN